MLTKFTARLLLFCETLHYRHDAESYQLSYRNSSEADTSRFKMIFILHT